MLMSSAPRRSLMMVATIASLSGCGLHGKPTVERNAANTSAAPSDATPGRTADPVARTAGLARAEVVAPGIVEPWGAQVDLASQEPGRMASILVKEGEVVTAGQLLATMDDDAQQRAVEIARADLAESEAELARMERGATDDELRQARAEHDAASARSTFARAAAARADRLHRDGSLPDNEAERAAADAIAQTALAERAAARLHELTRGARVEDRNATRARTEATRARLRMAEAGLARRRITAPSAGTVLLSRFHPGEFYDASAGPLFVLGDLTRLQVRLEVDEIDAHDLQGGSPCELVSDGGQALAHGTVVRLAPKMGRRALPLESPTARTDVRIREVFVEVNATNTLVPGQRVWGRAARTARNAS